MSLKVTVDVFSGRPNPVVVLEGREEQEVLARLRPGKRAAKGAARPQSFLGYRGIQFELKGGRRRTLPSSFRLWHGVLVGALILAGVVALPRVSLSQALYIALAVGLALGGGFL